MAHKKADHKFTQDWQHFSNLGKRVIEAIAKEQSTFSEKKVDDVTPPPAEQDYLSRMELPRTGMSAEDVLEVLEKHILPWPSTNTHRRSYAWINSPAAPISVLADTISTALNTGLDGEDNASMFLMVSLGQWLMELSGFPKENSMALLMSGGSAANLNALSVARYKAAKEDGWNIREEGLQGDHPPFVLYTSAEAHSSIQRCVEQLGLGAKSLRKVECSQDFCMNIDALRNEIEADLAKGLRPFCVVAAAGSTNTGAIDPLSEVADICEELGLWMHVDGAYGGIGGLDPKYEAAYEGIERANSLTLDPHKWLQVPMDCGALLLREPHWNRENFLLVPDYLEEGSIEEGRIPWPYEHMFELTFGNRALKTWASLARLGYDGVQELVVRCNQVASALENLIKKAPDMELLSPASLSILNFRYKPEGKDLDEDALDKLTEDISKAISECGEAHVPTSKVNGVVSLRVCVLHYENNEEDAQHLVALTRRLGEEILS